MSLAAMLWAFEKAPRCLTPAERFVLVALADHVDDEERIAWPSLNRIAARTGLGRSTVKRAVRQLEAQRIVSVDVQGAVWRRADRRTSLYLWHPEKTKQERQDAGQAALFRVDNSEPHGGPERTPVAVPEPTGVQSGPPYGGPERTPNSQVNQQSSVVTVPKTVTTPRARDAEPVDNESHSGEGFAAFLEAKRALETKHKRSAS